MGKVLRFLVVLICILSIAAVVLASMLFARREVLKGRTLKLEQGLIRLARTVEAQPPQPPESPAVYPERDVSAVTSEILDTPTRGQFWTGYKQQLESLDQPVVDLNPLRRDMMSYFRMDPVTGKPLRDPITGARVTEGPGTTQGIIDLVIERAGEQYNLLTETRQQLQATRRELVETIRDLNDQKRTLRDRLAHIVKLDNDIIQLNRTIADLRNEVARANERIQEQQLRIKDLEQDKLVLEEENDGLKIRADELAVIIRNLRGQLEVLQSGPVRVTDDPVTDPGYDRVSLARVDIAAGIKGRIVSVDERHLFVVMELDELFIQELLASLTDGRLPMVELHVQRGEISPAFVTKIRLTQLKQDRHLAIGDIMPDWQQMPIKVGDIIFYQ